MIAKAGIPVVALVTEEFVEQAHFVADSKPGWHELPNLSYADLGPIVYIGIEKWIKAPFEENMERLILEGPKEWLAELLVPEGWVVDEGQSIGPKALRPAAPVRARV